jgi:hypothetical protein
VSGADDEPKWLIHECRAGEYCEPDALPEGGGGAADAGAMSGMAACVGSCEQGASECVSASIARYCVDGRAWQLDPCSVGESCYVGICRPTSATAQADGLLPGACDTALECEDGEERCVEDGFVSTPLYQTCAGGQWRTTLETCSGDEVCLGYTDREGLRHKLCGAECVPGSRRCSASQLQECQNDGTWGTGRACGVGVCATLASNDAACVVECAPSTVRCTGSTVVGSDGTLAYTMEASCSSSGLLETATACGAGESCRVSRYGEHVGCVECIGSDVFGGNALGYIDTRCAPTNPDAVQSCGDDNTWGASRTCATGMSCAGQTTQECGICLSANGFSAVQCSEANLGTVQECGGCAINWLDELGDPQTLTLATCTASAIDAAPTYQPETCFTQFGVGTIATLDAVDCCNTSLAVQPRSATCTDLGHSAPSAWGGVSDCCGNYQNVIPTSRPLAYCAP